MQYINSNHYEKNMSDNSKLLTVGQRVRKSLEMKHLRPADLARRLNVNPGYISRLINDEIKNPQKHLSAIAECLNLNLEWLYTGTDQPYSKIPTTQISKEYPAEFIGKEGGLHKGVVKLSTPILTGHTLTHPDYKLYVTLDDNAHFVSHTAFLVSVRPKPEPGLFLGINDHGAVSVTQKIKEFELIFINKPINTQLIGKIIIMFPLEGTVSYETEVG